MKELQGHTHLIICFDGGCEPNPGPAAIGIVFYDHHRQRLATFSKRLGILTNNEAEYHALTKALQIAKDAGATHVAIYGDSQLVINQVKGIWKCSAANLVAHCRSAKRLKQSFTVCKLFWMAREKNAVADRLASQALGRTVGPIEEHIPYG